MRTSGVVERLSGRAPALVVALGVMLWLATFARFTRGLWFAGDDFDFLFQRSVTIGGDHGLLEPHNEHWSTLPILLYRLNFALFGLHHYTPYALLPISCHVVICVLLYLLMVRSDVARWPAALAALIALFAAGGAGSENTLWDFQVGFLGSGVMGLSALLLFATERLGMIGRAGGVLALVVALMSSGIGLVMVAWAGAFVFLRSGVKAAVLTVTAPVVVYLAWYAAYGRGHHAVPIDLPSAPAVAMHGLGHIWTAAGGMAGAGPVVLAGLVAATVLPMHTARRFALAASGLVSVIGAYALFGYSRSGTGLGAALVGRYVYFGIVLTIPALGAALHVIGARLAARPGRVPLVAWLTCAAVFVSIGTAQAHDSARRQRAAVAATPGLVVAAEHVVTSGAALLRDEPMPPGAPDITVGALRKASVRNALPDVRPNRRAELEVALNLQVDVADAPRQLHPPSGLRWHGFQPAARTSAPHAVSSGCFVRKAVGVGRIDVPLTGAPVELPIIVSGTTLDTGLVDGRTHSDVKRWEAVPGQIQYVAATAGDATLQIFVPPGDVTMCGIGEAS